MWKKNVFVWNENPVQVYCWRAGGIGLKNVYKSCRQMFWYHIIVKKWLNHLLLMKSDKNHFFQIIHHTKITVKNQANKWEKAISQKGNGRPAKRTNIVKGCWPVNPSLCVFCPIRSDHKQTRRHCNPDKMTAQHQSQDHRTPAKQKEKSKTRNSSSSTHLHLNYTWTCIPG